MSKQADTVPSLLPYEGCSREYSRGWRCAEEWLRNRMEAERIALPEEWSPEKAAGFRDRVAVAANL